MPYSIRVALQSLRQEKWINLLSALTISMGLLVVTLVILTVYNVNLFTKRLPERFSVIAYLKSSVSDQEAQQIIASLKSRKAVEKVKYISRTAALKELKSSLKDADYILEGLNENPLPASVEIRFKKEAVGPESVRSFVADIRKISGIEDVQYGETLLLSIHSIKTGVQNIGLNLVLIMAAGIIFVCYSTVKILFYRRKEEMETLKLLGATRGFIRAPFLLEGGAIGAGGGLIGLAIILVVYHGVFKKLSAAAPLLGSLVFPTEVAVLLPLAGLFLGITGALIAIGRIRF